MLDKYKPIHGSRNDALANYLLEDINVFDRFASYDGNFVGFITRSKNRYTVVHSDSVGFTYIDTFNDQLLAEAHYNELTSFQSTLCPSCAQTITDYEPSLDIDASSMSRPVASRCDECRTGNNLQDYKIYFC